MTLTQITEGIGQPNNSYMFAALLSESVKERLTHLILSLQSEIGDGLWGMPESAMHITLCEIIQPKLYAQDKQKLYDMHKYEYENIPVDIFSGFQPIHVVFDVIEVSSQAIIIRGTDDGSFNTLRRQLVDRLSLPTETRVPPNIVHSSIARFTKQMDLDTVKKVVLKHSIKLEETVEEFELINSLVPPLLNFKTIRTYRLGSNGIIQE